MSLHGLKVGMSKLILLVVPVLLAKLDEDISLILYLLEESLSFSFISFSSPGNFK